MVGSGSGCRPGCARWQSYAHRLAHRRPCHRSKGPFCSAGEGPLRVCANGNEQRAAGSEQSWRVRDGTAGRVKKKRPRHATNWQTAETRQRVREASRRPLALEPAAAGGYVGSTGNPRGQTSKRVPRVERDPAPGASEPCKHPARVPARANTRSASQVGASGTAATAAASNGASSSSRTTSRP